MSAFAKLETTFHTNWTTVLVGWTGFGVLSPWPDRWEKFPPLISADEINAYSEKKIISSADTAEQDLIIDILLIEQKNKRREQVKDLLEGLSNWDRGIPALELRKWRLTILEELLENIPKDAIYGPLALSEFWQEFGFPADSPHDIQGRGNSIHPLDYYKEENFQKMLDRHYEWVRQEQMKLVN